VVRAKATPPLSGSEEPEVLIQEPGWPRNSGVKSPDSPRHRLQVVDHPSAVDRLAWDDLDIQAFASDPLDQNCLRCLRYMHDVEYHTVCYLRDLLLTPAHVDPAVTEFLSVWVYQEYWHGEALASVLAAHAEPHGAERLLPMRHRLGWKDKVRPLLMGAGGILGGDDFVAVHMAWGAVNEWMTQAGYSLLGRRAAHPVLSELVGRIMRQEGRHIAFYSSQARERLAASPRAQRLARFALQRFWKPVGAGVMPEAETRFLARFLMGDEIGRAAAGRIDRQIDGLPGLGGLHLVTTAITDALPPAVPLRTDRVGPSPVARAVCL
jgi:hypothetical protein